VNAVADQPQDSYSDFVARAIDRADPNILRMALLQITGDESLARMKVQKTVNGIFNTDVLAPEHHEEVKQKTLAYLKNRASIEPRVLSTKEVRSLMGIFVGKELTDKEFRFGYEELALEEFPREARWSNKPAKDVLDKFHVTIIGAGIAGLAMAIQLDRLGIRYSVFERQDGVGGTWRLNNYPQCRVDVPYSTYQYKFDKKYNWESLYPTHEESRKYLEYIAEKFAVRSKCRFGTSVTAATWDEAAKRWTVEVRGPDGVPETLQTNVVVSAAGVFSTPQLPDIEGIGSFQRPMFHTTNWDHDLDFSGKRVAVIGNGSSGAQVMPAIAPLAKSLTVFQRTPQWVMPLDNYQGKVSPESKWVMDNIPFYWNWHNYSAFRSMLHLQDLQEFDPQWQQQGGAINELNDKLRDSLVSLLKNRVGDGTELFHKLLPKTAPLGRRFVMDNGWYDALLKDNVDLVTEGIERFTTTGIITRDGRTREFDIVVLGSGFKTSTYFWPTQYRGRAGADLQDLWRQDGPRSYLGMTFPGFPNLFCMYGPNAQPRTVGFHSWSEAWTRYIAGAIVGMLESGHSAIEVRRDVYEEYNQSLDEAEKKLLWAQEGKGSYYVNEYGRSDLNVAFRVEDFYERLAHPDLGEYSMS